MKRLRVVYVSIFLALFTGFFTSCDDDEEDTVNPSGNGTMSATVEGTSWQANITVQGVYITQGGANSLTIVGSTDQGEGLSSTISLNLLGVTDTGTFSVDGSSVTNLSSATYAFTTGTSAADAQVFNSIMGRSGSVTITEFSTTRVSGTFSFTGAANGGAGTRTVTNGEFSVNL